MSEGLGEWDDEPEGTTAGGERGEDDADAPELFYPNVAEFVTNKLAVTYRRQLNIQGGDHLVPPVVEALRSHQPPRSLLVRLRTPTPRRHHRHGCDPADGHRTKLAPLPCDEPAAGLF